MTTTGRIVGNITSLAALVGPRPEQIAQLRILSRSREPIRTLSVEVRPFEFGGRTRRFAFMRDITEQLEREEAIRGFASAVAHDLRGPLSSVRGWLELAADELDAASPEAGLLRRAEAGSDRLSAIIEDWLQFSLVRTGALASERVPLAPVIDDVAEGLLTSDVGTMTVSIDVSFDVGADPRLVCRVLANLLGNALRYRRRDVAPAVAVRSREYTPGWVQVAVVDNGIGVTAGEEGRIFDMFHRSGSASAIEGSRIGLATCRDIIERHGGAIWAQRNPDGGSTFSFTLPAPSADEPARPRKPVARHVGQVRS